MDGSGNRAMKMGEPKTVPVAFRKPEVAAGTSPLAITVARLFGLDAGDWSLILLGLALSAVVFAIL